MCHKCPKPSIFDPIDPRNGLERARAVRAYFSKFREGEEVDIPGVMRACGVPWATAETTLNALVKEGKAYQDGHWYGTNNPAP